MKFKNKVAMIVASLGVIGMLKANVFASSITYSGATDEIDRTQTQSATIVGADYSYMIEAEGVYIVGYNGSSKDVVIPETIDGITVYAIYSEAFSWGAKVETVTIPKTVKSIYSDAFINCLTLKNIYVDLNNTTYYSENGMLYSKDKEYLVVCPCGKTGEVSINNSCKYICDYAFLNVGGITKINLPSKLFEIGDAAFYDTLSLETLTLDSNNKYFKITDGVLYQRNVETGKEEIAIKCPDKRVNAVTIPSTVKEIIMDAFYGCKSLKGPLNIPANVEKIGDGAFWNCQSLTGNIVIPEKTSSIGMGAFYNCSSVSSITIGSRITEIPNDCFAYCSNIKTLTIPNSVTAIGDRAFFYCTNVETLKLSENLKTIGDWAFDYLYNLKGNVVIPDFVTKIGTNAFEHSKNIDGYIIIGKNVATMGENVFRTASNAKGVVFKGNAPLFGNHTFDEPTDVPYYHTKNAFGFNYVLKDKIQKIYSENPEITYMVNGEVYKTQRLNTFGIVAPLINEPTIENYAFGGWYEDEELTKVYDDSQDIMNDITLYAKLDKLYHIEPLENNILLEMNELGKIELDYALEDGDSVSMITYESLNNDIVIVDQNGNLTPKGVGETTIKIRYKELERKVSVTVWKDQSSMSFVNDTLDMQVGTSELPLFNYHLVNGEFKDIEWNVEDEDVVRCSNGRFYAMSVGTTTVTASYEDVSTTITVNVCPKSFIKMNVGKTLFQEGETENISLDYYFFKDNTDNVYYTTSNDGVAYVENSKIIAVAPGSATITVSHGDITDSIVVDVVPRDYVVISDDTQITLEDNEGTYALNYSYYSFFTDKVEWSSNNESVVTVTEDGVLVIKGLGDAVVEAKINNATDYIAVHVVKANTINFATTESVFRYMPNEEIILDLDYSFNDGATENDITYTSTNPEVVEVLNGKLYQRGIGQTTITVAYKNARDSEKITIIPQDYIRTEKEKYILGLGEITKIELDYFIYENDNPSFKYEVENEDIASIDEEGNVTAISEGKTNIKITCNDLEYVVPLDIIDKTKLKGDVNLDGVINVEDAAMILDFFKYSNQTELQFYLGDVNEDGVLNVEDAGRILDMYKGLI